MRPGARVASPDRQAASVPATGVTSSRAARCDPRHAVRPPAATRCRSSAVSRHPPGTTSTSTSSTRRCELSGSSATGAADESTVIPGGTAYVVSQLYTGANIPIALHGQGRRLSETRHRRHLTTFGT